MTQRQYTNSSVKKKSSLPVVLRTTKIKVNRSLIGIVSQILQCFLRAWRADISVLSQVRILYVNEKEKRYRRNMMFLFAGHSDKPLKSLISMAHKGNHICLYRFSFIYVMDDLWEDAYICPIYTVDRTTESAKFRYGTHGYGMNTYKERWRQNAVVLNVMWFADDKRRTSRSFIFGFCRS